MKEHPILFSAPMILAILAGRKTQTRRLIKFPKSDYPNNWDGGKIEADKALFYNTTNDRSFDAKCMYGQTGDHLWVRESFVWTWNEQLGKWDAFYKADGDYVYDDRGPARWKPSIHMPRMISRITLEVTGVHVERLKDISNEDSLKEGVHSIISFKGLWCTIHGDGAWGLNPWVWVVEFKRIT